MRQLHLGFVVSSALAVLACTGGGGSTDPDADPSMPGPDAGPGDPPPPPSMTVEVTLEPRAGVSGTQRVNFAVPFARGWLADAEAIVVRADGLELPAARRVLATHADGSARSVQLQVETAVASGTVLEVAIGETPTTTALELAPVASTLDPADGTLGPRVWARLPAEWLSASGVAGPEIPEADVAGTPLDAWGDVCDYANHSVTEFLAQMASKDVWLFDRGTAMYRGYVRRGDRMTLESAYRETAIYRAGLTGSGAMHIGVPGSDGDLKYHYSQNLAIHYLLTGDDRFREAAEGVAMRVQELWTSPGYSGGADFWTERHAGFGLLAYVWAAIVSDDRAGQFLTAADEAVDAYLAMQAAYPPGHDDPDARCFAHQADAHGEDYGTWGCSPWMSAILADGLDQYATERGGAEAAAARASIVKLGRILARDGRAPGGRPYYWMGLGSTADVADDYDEHWGESAYVIAMAWFHDGKSDASLRAAADSLMEGLASDGESGHLRSFNWQCRSAVGAAYYLK